MAKETKKKNNITIGASLFSRAIPFHQELEKGLNEETKKQGNELITYSADYDNKKQAEQVKSLISQKVDVIVICPVDSFSIGESIIQANKAGIPVITADTANLSGKGKVISHIASDNFQGGKLGGKLLARAIKYEGKVVILTHPTITSFIDRVNGFKETIKIFPDIEIIDEINILSKRKETEIEMKKFLKGKSEIDGIFSVSDESALGALKSVESMKKSGKIMIVGYDAIPEVRMAIAKGRIYADVRQFPIKIGHETIKIINEYFEGLKIPPIVYVEIGTWT